MKKRIDGKNGWKKDFRSFSWTEWAWQKNNNCTWEPCIPPKRKKNEQKNSNQK